MKDGYKEALLELVDADVLPAFLGGNKTDPDGNPNCHQTVSTLAKEVFQTTRAI